VSHFGTTQRQFRHFRKLLKSAPPRPSALANTHPNQQIECQVHPTARSFSPATQKTMQFVPGSTRKYPSRTISGKVRVQLRIQFQALQSDPRPQTTQASGRRIPKVNPNPTAIPSQQTPGPGSVPTRLPALGLFPSLSHSLHPFVENLSSFSTRYQSACTSNQATSSPRYLAGFIPRLGILKIEGNFQKEGSPAQAGLSFFSLNLHVQRNTK